MERIVLIASVFALGCGEQWTPIRSARDVAGEPVKIEHAGGEVQVNEVVVCDAAGFVVARYLLDCHDALRSFDVRRDKTFVLEKSHNVPILVALGITAGLLITAFVATATVVGGMGAL